MPLARWCYTALFYLLMPFILLRLLWRGRRAPQYRQRIGERFGGFNSPNTAGGIWIHAVSVGETIAAAPLVRALLQGYPHYPITVTTMTPTGSERVRALFGDRVFHVYAPYDIPLFVERFLRRVKPRLMIIMETELWPNTIAVCARKGIPVLLANARLSQKSARGYARLRALAQPMLGQLARVVAQNAEDGNRFIELGLPAQKLSVSGSIKFDIALEPQLIERARQQQQQWSQRPVWIAASTHAGEDEIILQAQRQLQAQFPTALLILVPRHPERFSAVAALIEQNGFSYRRRSTQQSIAGDTEILLGDTMGELLFFYGCADVAFVGGSLVARGGHNTLEPAAWALPIITGASDFNFREISALLQRAGALQKVTTADALAAALTALFADAPLRHRRGALAQQVVEKNRGALEKLLADVAALLPRQS